ncbi:MAG: NAD(P)-dependent oxidoreductase [Deltaproteobacteria bacterium]|nr:NAD(P)-dependent oxidoreductase [Deltaproteobacteria bacterium]
MDIASPERTRVGWIGTGMMGRSMCGHVLKAGYPVVVFNRTKSSAEPLLDRGAGWADSPADVARRTDVLFSIVGYPQDVRQVYLGENGVVSGMEKGRVIVDMTTSEPSLAVEIAVAAETRGLHSLDAPVSGGDVGAREARLSIMVGGERDVFDAVMPLFQTMGKSIRYMGPAGAGQHMKAANQIMVAGTMVGMVESLLYASKAGLNPDQVIEVICGGAAACWSMENYGPRIVKGDMEPGFIIQHFLKDMNVVLKEAESMNLPLPGVSLSKQLYIAAKAHGYGERGTQALFRAMAILAAVDEHPAGKPPKEE